jgi:hypothetical protein
MSIDEATVSNMERKGPCTKQDIYDIITEFRRKNPREDPLDVDDRAVG